MKLINPPPPSPELKAALSRANKSMAIIAEAMPSVTADDEPSIWLAMYSSIVWQHFQAILLVCERGAMPASALALFRPLAEAVLRGQWLKSCASPDQLASFNKDVAWQFPNFKDLVVELERRPGFERFFVGLSGAYRDMCDYAHGGYSQATGNFAGLQIGPAYDKDLILRLVKESEKLAVFHAFIYCDLSNHSEGTKKLAALDTSFLQDSSTQSPRQKHAIKADTTT